jgi:hypothetical protein
MLSPSKCIGAWQDALKAGTVGLSHCYAASKLPESEQAELLALKLSGASRDQLEQEGRKNRNGVLAVPAVRMAKVKIALHNNVSVVLTGASLGMCEVVDILSEALKEARKAAARFDVKTFVSMMRDQAQS